MSDLFLPSVSDDLRRSSVFSVLFALAALQSERTVNVLGVTSLWTTSVLISAWDWYDVHMLTDWIPSGPIWLKNMFLTDDETALELLKWFVPWSFKKEFILLFWRWLLFRSSVTDFVECTGFICAHWGYKKFFFPPMSLHTACPAFSICAAPPTELTAVHTTRGWKVTNCSAILCCSKSCGPTPFLVELAVDSGQYSVSGSSHLDSLPVPGFLCLPCMW